MNTPQDETEASLRRLNDGDGVPLIQTIEKTERTNMRSPQAFPVSDQYETVPGMSLRDWFAGMALQGILANPLCAEMSIADAATSARVAADTMIAARKEES